MKAILCLLLTLAPAQEFKSCPLIVNEVELKRPSYQRRGDRHRLEISLTNLANKDVNSITFEVEFWDYRHDVVADKIKGVAGDPNPKYVLLKASQKKTITSYLIDYPPPDNWSVDKSRFKIVFIKFTDGSVWIPEKKKE